MNKELAPICLFTYNRLEETKQTVMALKKNFRASESELFIFSDGAKDKQSEEKINQVRKYLKTVFGFKDITIFESLKNKGLANSIINGVTQIIGEYGKVIVLEDDLVTTPNFLNFMNRALDFYENNEKIQSINGFSLKIKLSDTRGDVYFHQRTFPWGWATWQNKWDDKIFDKNQIKNRINKDKSVLSQFRKACGEDIVNMLKASLDGRNNSWYVRWVFDHFINNTYAVYPILSKVENVGFNNDGTHCNEINVYKSIMDNRDQREFVFNNFNELGYEINADFLNFFKKSYRLLYRIRLLGHSSGRNQVKNEINQKLFKNYFLFK